jgi:hypothetical protein
MWKNLGVWTCLQGAIYEQTRSEVGRSACPSMVIMDGQSVKTTERGGVRGFDGHKRVKGRKRHILVDTLGLPIACRVELANIKSVEHYGILSEHTINCSITPTSAPNRNVEHRGTSAVALPRQTGDFERPIANSG